MKKIHYNKLVRDRIPTVIQAKGAAYKTTRLGQRAFILELLKKVGEEASSLPRLKKKQDITDELADTLDVIKAIQQTLRISGRDIRAAQAAARKRKGWFNQRLFLHWAEDNGYRTNERRNAH